MFDQEISFALFCSLSWCAWHILLLKRFLLLQPAKSFLASYFPVLPDYQNKCLSTFFQQIFKQYKQDCVKSHTRQCKHRVKFSAVGYSSAVFCTAPPQVFKQCRRCDHTTMYSGDFPVIIWQSSSNNRPPNQAQKKTNNFQRSSHACE